MRKMILQGAGIPRSIVTNWGSLFTSDYWLALAHYLRFKRNLTTAFYSQFNGQTKRQNQTVKAYLRAYINHLQDNWIQWLPQAKFSYNNSQHASTQCSPFFALMGQHPRLEETIGKIPEDKGTNVLAAHKRAKAIMTIRQKLKPAYQESLLDTAKYYNKKIEPMTHAIGNKVWLLGKNLTTIRPCKKLDCKFHGPFWVLDVINKNTYRLELPLRLKIHTVFHALLLEPANKM